MTAEERPLEPRTRAGDQTGERTDQPLLVPPTGGALADSDLRNRLSGKVFFTKQTGGNFTCDATIVNSRNKSMIDTAGHCVSDGAGRFHRDWVFVPGYSSSDCSGCETRPYGTWTARTLTTTTEWHSYSNGKQDLGYAVLNTLGGQRIVDVLGGQGSALDQSRDQVWTVLGYRGSEPGRCVSGHRGDDDPSPGRPGPLTIRIQCDLTGGGGGWLIKVHRGLGYLNGHSAYRYAFDPGHVHGPYYGAEARALFPTPSGSRAIRRYHAAEQAICKGVADVRRTRALHPLAAADGAFSRAFHPVPKNV